MLTALIVMSCAYYVS